jgi:hypothetical protein
VTFSWSRGHKGTHCVQGARDSLKAQAVVEWPLPEPNGETTWYANYRCWLGSALMSLPHNDWNMAQTRHSAHISAALGPKADLPRVGLNRLVVTRTGQKRCEKLVKIGARIVRHGRYVMFQLADVAVPRALFAEILRRINRLRLKPPPVLA